MGVSQQCVRSAGLINDADVQRYLSVHPLKVLKPVALHVPPRVSPQASDLVLAVPMPATLHCERVRLIVGRWAAHLFSQ